jgi:quercetin dioxygenase-like cupin family protein
MRADWTGEETFAHWLFDEGAEIHEHHHEQEEVWHLLDGGLEVTPDGERSAAKARDVLILAQFTRHQIRVIEAGRATVADPPVQKDFGG